MKNAFILQINKKTYNLYCFYKKSHFSRAKKLFLYGPIFKYFLHNFQVNGASSISKSLRFSVIKI